MSKFNGKWKDQANVNINVTATGRTLVVNYDNGRGPFTGHEIDHYYTVIDVNFNDAKPETGVLSDNGTHIYWSNGTQWTKL